MTISERIIQYTSGSYALFILPTAVDSVVSFYGTLFTAPDLADNDDVLQDVATALLDKGTTLRDKFAIAADLESRGAEISFSSQSTRLAFSGQCLSKDIDPVLRTCAEQLRTPSLLEEEMDKLMPRLKASVLQSMESTSARATAGLRRLLFRQDHPNYSYLPEEEMRLLDECNIDGVRRFYESHIGANELVLVVVGDVDEKEVASVVEGAFADWSAAGVSREYLYDAPRHDVTTTSIPMADKQNVDIRIGHVVDLRRLSDDFVPLYLANYIFGGNFSARLMDVIRDREGLTYGIYSSLAGVSSDYSGYFQVQATFSIENLERGIDRTNELIRSFIEEGITRDELAIKKETVAGSYQVGLASTGSLARTIGLNVHRGLGVDYVDRFPELVRQSEVEEVNVAIRKWLEVDALRLSRAGMLENQKIAL